MTGAIQFNMILVCPPVTIWSIFIGPHVVSLGWNVAIGMIMAVVLTVACLPLSRRIWAWTSDWMDRNQF